MPFSYFLTDSLGRQHDYLRISLTERCNLRYTHSIRLSTTFHLHFFWDDLYLCATSEICNRRNIQGVSKKRNLIDLEYLQVGLSKLIVLLGGYSVLTEVSSRYVRSWSNKRHSSEALPLKKPNIRA